MSLLVNVYILTSDGNMGEVLDAQDSWHELAGFESYRQQLYGSNAARALGLKLLPSLDGSDLYVQGPDVERLRAECEMALSHLDSFIAEAEASCESLRPRFENIIRAAKWADEIGGGVVIW